MESNNIQLIGKIATKKDKVYKSEMPKEVRKLFGLEDKKNGGK